MHHVSVHAAIVQQIMQAAALEALQINLCEESGGSLINVGVSGLLM